MFDRIAIIGIGLIGASIAHAAREAGAAKTVALYDADGAVRQRARELDASRYFTRVRWDGAGSFTEVAPHHFKLEAGPGGEALAFACEFAPEAGTVGKRLGFDEVRASSVAE